MRKITLFIAIATLFFGSVEGVSYYECGLYAGVQAGWASINSPTKNNIGDKAEGVRLSKIEHNRGGFAWGVNAGYLYPFQPDAFVGVEGGYHDNGFSSLIFANQNEYRVESTDAEILATGTYLWRPRLWFTAKFGGCRVRQTYRVWHLAQNSDIDPTGVVEKWVPTTTLGLGYNFCNFDLYFNFRYVFGSDQKGTANTFVVNKSEDSFNGTFGLKDKVASVYAFYVGLQASIY